MTSGSHPHENGRPSEGESSLEGAGRGSEVTLAEEASRFKMELVGESRSTTLSNLFDYLVERSNDPRAPKEIEVAIAVFGKNGTFDTSQNSMVRGYMHRLRQRLDKFNAGKTGLRLTIPKGEYRLTLSEAPDNDREEDASPDTPPTIWKRMWTVRTASMVIGANLCIWALVFLFGHSWPTPPPLAQTALWKSVIANGRTPVVAVGDFFLYAKSGADGRMERLSMNPEIQTEAELSSYLMTHPEYNGKLHNRDIYRVPAREAKSAMAILNLVSAMRPGKDIGGVVPVSRISQDRIDSSNIIYIQYFSQLGTLRSPILHLSGFAPTDDFNQIRDVASGKIYQARYSAGEGTPTGGSVVAANSYGYDYGYVASFPGSAGTHNILISGISDEGLSQMVKLVADKRQLDSLAQKTDGGRSFEALYQVRTIGGLVFDTKLLVVRSLKADGTRGPVG